MRSIIGEKKQKYFHTFTLRTVGIYKICRGTEDNKDYVIDSIEIKKRTQISCST